MKGIIKYTALICLFVTVSFAFTKSDAYYKHELPRQDSIDVNKLKPISYDELVYMVDSILDLDSVSPVAIEMINHYSAELEKMKTSKLAILPAEEFYADFDEQTVFAPATEDCLPELLNLAMTSDSLGNYTAPINGIVTSNYGWREKRMHKGIDIDLNKGDKVLAAFDGKVRIARRQNGYGNVVIVRHYNGLETVYAHLSKIKVKSGQVITSGQVVGLGGMTGHATGTHLHFEIRFKGHALNPANLISFTDNKIYNDTLTLRKSKYGLAAFPSNATVYTVVRGDSWYEIAKRYGLTSQQMKALNGTDKRFYLKVGQQIRIN